MQYTVQYLLLLLGDKLGYKLPQQLEIRALKDNPGLSLSKQDWEHMIRVGQGSPRAGFTPNTQQTQQEVSEG